VFYCFSFSVAFPTYNNKVFAQQYDDNIQTKKYRDLIVDLGDGVKTHAQLTLPAIGKGPFPGVLLVPGSGAVDMNETITTDIKPFWQISEYLTDRGFVVLKYDKRGIGANNTIVNENTWGNLTVDDLKRDAETALTVLSQQPEADPKRLSIIGHSEGTVLVPRIAMDNPEKVKNIILMGTVAENYSKLQFQSVTIPISYAKQMLDKNGTGYISSKEAINDPTFRFLSEGLLFYLLPNNAYIGENNNTLYKILTQEIRNFTDDGFLNIDNQLKPLLVKAYEKATAYNTSKCGNPSGCPKWFRSELKLEPTINLIGNISSNTGILILNGENDLSTKVQQAFLLQQRLTEVNHPDHTLITYPTLGHYFHESSEWIPGVGPMPEYVLADLFSWLEYHNGLSRSLITGNANIMQ
jgi:alpha-beta hydrolase superfamily lysophospholipase